MNKDDLKKYIIEAIDAMDGQDIEKLFPRQQQPDLYTIASELIGLKGEVKKLAGVSLKLNNEVKNVIEAVETHQQSNMEQEPDDIEADKLNETQFKILLNQLIDHDDLIKRTQENLDTIPAISHFNLGNFKIQYASWLEGYKITLAKWQQFMKNTGLVKTGVVGEKFNPQYHEAIGVKQLSNMTNNTILETEVTGYIFQQVLVRPAKVVVNKV